MDDAELETGGQWHDDLRCSIRSLTYDFIRHEGVLWLREGDCTDMSGAIKMFYAIDPEVSLIITMSGRDRDTRYLRGAGYYWRAVDDRGRWPACQFKPDEVNVQHS